MLKKALYGLKQSPMRWNEHFTSVLKSIGLIHLKSEQCIFKNESSTLFLAIYVDDGLILGNDEEQINILIQKLTTNFEIVSCKNPTSFLGIEICKGKDSIKLSQSKYISEILDDFGLENMKPVSTPMIYNPSTDDTCLNKVFPYRELVGTLLYVSNKTRPDISYAVGYCSRKLDKPSERDVGNIKRILRYLVSTINLGIQYTSHSEDLNLLAYSDSDFAGDIYSRKSTTGYIIKFCGGPVAWCSKRQPIVSLSSTEAEYIAAAECIKEALFLKSVIDELLGVNININLHVDNQSAITIIKNGQFNKRSKHIDVRYHFINEKVSEGIVKLFYCPSSEQLADSLTKPLDKVKFQIFQCNTMLD